jgi:hypothetical protein
MNTDWIDSAPKYGSQIVETRGTQPYLTEIYKLSDDTAVLQWNLQRMGRLARSTSVLDAEGKERYRIERERRMPYSRCVLRTEQGHIWTLTTLSVFRHRYKLQFASGVVWKFKAPFFSVGMEGIEGNKLVVAGGMDSEFRWMFAIHPKADSAPVAIAVALLHEHRFGS